jgi:hypothetical protein
MSAVEDSSAELTSTECRDLRRLAGFMVPANAEYGVPGADDEAIFADIVRSLGRDKNFVRTALTMLREISGGDFAELAETQAETAAMTLLTHEGPVITALGRAVLQCYYRDDRVMRALGLEARAPYPRGHVLEQGDWSLLDAIRDRPRMWRDIDGTGK